MSNRVSVLRYIIENGESKRDDVITALLDDPEADTNPLRQTFYQMVRSGHLDQHGDTADASTTYTITESGTDYYERNKDKPPRKPHKRSSGSAPQEVVAAPVLPNISVSAEGLADQVSAVLAENSELRNTLVEIRSTINRLLGDQPTEDQPRGEVLEFGGDM